MFLSDCACQHISIKVINSADKATGFNCEVNKFTCDYQVLIRLHRAPASDVILFQTKFCRRSMQETVVITWGQISNRNSQVDTDHYTFTNVSIP